MTTARVGVDITARDSTSGAFLSAISNVNKLAKATQGFGDRQRNMAFQVNDIFAQLSTGTSPMTVLLQQGPQIAQIYGFGNGGVAAAFRDVGNMVLSVAKKVGPWAALAGAAAAAVTYEVNRVTGETYSMGEVFSATIDVISESITATLMPVIKGISPTTNSVLDAVMGKARSFGNVIIGVNLAWLEVVKRGLSELPDLFKYFGGLAANFFVQQIESMINAVTGLLNRFASGINRIFEMLPKTCNPASLGRYQHSTCRASSLTPGACMKSSATRSRVWALILVPLSGVITSAGLLLPWAAKLQKTALLKPEECQARERQERCSTARQAGGLR